jgi:AraC family transcriptional regulator
VVGGRFLTLSVGTDALAALRPHAARDCTPQRAVVFDHAEAVSAAHRLAGACTRRGHDAAYEQQALALELLCHADNTWRHAHRASSSPHEAPAWLRLACEYLDDSLGGQASIAEAARVAGVHPVHLARVFRRFTGLSPTAYLRRRRIEQAQCLLQHSTRTLGDIAAHCGFSDQSHFTHAFGRACGVSPSMYRTARGVRQHD